MIEVRDIHKYYGDLQVLKGIDLKIKPSEVVSITGASGAGKTTLLQILGTLDKPDRGQLFIDGQEVFTLKEQKLANFRNKNIGFVFQFHHLLPEFSCFENVCIPAYIGKRQVKEVEARAKELLDYLNMGHRMNHKPSELSGGEQQRVAIARALINNPKIVFADEPSGNLDKENTEEIHKLFFQLRNDLGHTFVIVTHDEYLARLCDRTIHLEDGRIV